MTRCMNCSSSTHEIEDCTVDTKDDAARRVVAEATRAAHAEPEPDPEGER